MARESTITHEQVASVCDQMTTAGTKPTSRSVREALGNTGSMGTINKMIQSWKASQVRTVTASLVLPVTIQNTILDFMDRELSSAKSMLQAELIEQQQEASDLATENQRLLAETLELTEDLESVRANLSTQEGRAGQLQTDLVVAREEAARVRAGAETVRIELAKAQLRLEAMPRLEADLVTLRAELEKEHQARVSAEQSTAVLSAQKMDLEARVTRLDGGFKETRARNETLTQDLSTEKVRVQATHALLEAAARDLDEAKKEATAAREKATKAGEEAAELRGQLAKVSKDIEDAKKG